MSDERSDAQSRQRAWALLATVEDHPQIQAWLGEAETPVGDTPEISGSPLKPVARWTQRVTRSSRLPWALATALTLAFGIGFGVFRYLGTSHYETHVGEQRDVLLADGSRVTLNTDTALTVRYSRGRRYIELERGEALFAVRHDATRPFEVLAGEMLMRALGTEFNVDLRTSHVTVSVLEGAVRIVPAGGNRQAPASRETIASINEPVFSPTALAKGQALEFSPRERRVRAVRADLKRIDAWRTRRLEFSDTPLAEAVEEFNRYSTTRVTIGTPELTSVRVSGVFRIGDADGFLFSLQDALDVETRAAAGEVVLLRSD